MQIDVYTLLIVLAFLLFGFALYFYSDAKANNKGVVLPITFLFVSATLFIILALTSFNIVEAECCCEYNENVTHTQEYIDQEWVNITYVTHYGAHPVCEDIRSSEQSLTILFFAMVVFCFIFIFAFLSPFITKS